MRFIEIIFAPDFFNNLMIFLSICAAIRWRIESDYSQALYWLLAAGLTATVTYGFKS